ARRLVTAYPTATNWRDAVLSYRDVARLDAASTLDLWRLLRATGALAGERDYLAAATAFDQANLAGEAKAVIDEGVSRNMLRASESETRALTTRVNGRATTERGGLTARIASARNASTGASARTAADALLAHGRHAEAAELYRLALTKGGEDADLVNLRLGEALALAGQTAEARTALQTVAGQRAEVARLWLAWVASRPAGPAAPAIG
ncbi:MAG TPA: tetratricopeptide repeat protein, partial [Allosphingosinicella sp.]